MTADEAAKAPADMKMKDMTGMAGYKFAISVSALDCTGCGSCANVCPGMKGNKALVMESLEANLVEQAIFDFGQSLPVKEEVLAKFKENTVKGSQFRQPLLEFSGACAGMLLAQNAIRDGLKAKVESVMANEKATDEMKAACKEWLDTFGIGALNGTATDKLVAVLDGVDCDVCRDIVKNKDFLAKKSQWVFGGDGWAYDIGFGGVDHVLASGKDINIMVYDTEVYSNTGGQSSKATKTGAVAQFAAGGKDVKKKDLASIAMSYGYVYVAQICMGADMAQTVKAIAEAEAYPGPSLIIAYAPCINHGIKKGMDKAQTEEKLAVECGYWNNFRYNPAAEKKFSLDSKAPKLETYQDFLKGEVRYMSLAMKNPERAAELFARNEAEAKERYAYLEKLVTLYGND